MYNVAQQLELLSRKEWWDAIDDFALGFQFRDDLQRLARQNASDVDLSKGTLSFLISQGIAQMAVNLLPFFQHLIIKCGEQGVLVAMHTSGWPGIHSDSSGRLVVAAGKSGQIVLQHFPALRAPHLISVTGAGDSLVGVLAGNLVENPAAFDHVDTMKHAINQAQEAAVLTLESSSAVSPLLTNMRKTNFV